MILREEDKMRTIPVTPIYDEKGHITAEWKSFFQQLFRSAQWVSIYAAFDDKVRLIPVGDLAWHTNEEARAAYPDQYEALQLKHAYDVTQYDATTDKISTKTMFWSAEKAASVASLGVKVEKLEINSENI